MKPQRDHLLSLDRELADELEALRGAGLLRSLRSVEGRQAPRMVVNGREALMFAGANYLGLAGDPRLRDAAYAALDEFGCAAGGARLISGNTRYHEALEAGLAAFLDTEASLLFSTGYVANLGVITALAGPEDVIFSDQWNHASIIDAIRLSRAEAVVFPHNDYAQLERLVSGKTGFRRRLLVVDGLFSMDGDVANLAEASRIAAENDLVLVVDDAHGIGVLGPNGRGACEASGIRPHVQIGNLGKALGSFGAFVACSKTLRDYLVNRSRPFIFTCGLPPSMAAAASAALEILRREPERSRAVLALANSLNAGLREAGFETGSSTSQIIPAMVGDNSDVMRLTEEALAHGIFTQGIRFPSVPEGTARLRLTTMYGHTPQDIDRVIEVLGEARRKLRLDATTGTR